MNPHCRIGRVTFKAAVNVVCLGDTAKVNVPWRWPLLDAMNFKDVVRSVVLLETEDRTLHYLSSFDGAEGKIAMAERFKRAVL